jgi:hypothetical protein
MAKKGQETDISDIQFSKFDRALFGTLFAMCKVLFASYPFFSNIFFYY